MPENEHLNPNPPAPLRSYAMQRTIGGILWLNVFVAILVMLGTTPKSQEQQPATNIIIEQPEIDLVEREVADFSLTERSTETITKQDLLGKPWVVNFIFTKCVMSCPTNTKAMMELAEKCKGTDVRFVTITVDPERDTPEQLKGYAEIYDADPEQWLFLTGDKAEIHRLIRESFLQIVEEREGDDRLLGYEFAHTDRVMHIDETGKIVGQYLATDPVEMATLARVLKGERETPEGNKFLVPKSLPNPLNIEAPEAGTSEAVSAEESSENPKEVAEVVVEDSEVEPAKEVPTWITNLPAVNASLNGLATLLLMLGFVLIKQGKIQAHKATMLTTFGVSVVFLGCYLTYHFGLQYYTGEAQKSFPDLGFIRQVYLTILISHIILAVFVPVLAGMTIFYGLTNRIEKHRRIARVTFPIWLYVSVTGVIIYLMLYQLAGV
ncbi:DUF420 domain-containing protein [uncultured Rubinisphaera sp.]|uniref:DUF420 domain-containing protein n=1 Tax=uncultured Rubinisphaera sp. TaxID=1678686 RepID=UPI0030D7BD75